MVRVLFVCLGNICRSPTVEGVFARQVQQAGLGAHIQVDSAATGDWHNGAPVDPRSAQAAQARGYDLSSLRARQVTATDFVEQDLILAMDRANLRVLQQRCPAAHRHKLHLFLALAEAVETQEVPDPYHGQRADFDRVVDLAEQGGQALLQYIRSHCLR